MPSSDAFREYIETVCRQVRWKRVHPSIAAELETHMCDQCDAFQAEGDDAQTAEEKAICEMGDAVVIGQAFDTTHRPKPQWTMLSIVAVLLLMGIGLRLFLFTDAEVHGNLRTMLLSCGIGIAVMCATYFADFSLLGKHPYVFANIVVYTTLLTSLLFPGLVNGRHVSVAPVGAGITISSNLLLLYPLVVAVLVYANRKRSRKEILIFCIILAVLAVIGVLCAANYIVSTFHVSRWQSIFHPELDPTGHGYFPLMIREMLAGAKWFGHGAVSDVHHTYLAQSPVAATDILLVTLAVRVGWGAVAAILVVFATLLGMGFRLCCKQRSVLGKMVSFAVLFTLAAQMLLYVVYNLGFPFLPPMTLPLVSRSGTAMVMNMGLIGIMLSVFRTGDVVSDVQPAPKKQAVAI